MSGIDFDLEEQLRFYGAYHHNPVNIGIHMLCVPMILLSTIQLGTLTPSIPLPDLAKVPYMPVNIGTITAVGYAVYYMMLEPVAGTLVAPFLLGATAWFNHLSSTTPQQAGYIAAGAWLFSWIAQFVGHGFFEGRAPALRKNTQQALVLAPMFCWLEFLFALGYRSDLKARVDVLIEKDVADFKKQQALKSKSNGSANGHAKAH